MVEYTCELHSERWHLVLDQTKLLQADTQATLKRLSPDTLMAVLRSDNLRVPSEMHVFRSVVSWLEADKSRLQQVRALFAAKHNGEPQCNECDATGSKDHEPSLHCL